MQLGNLRDQFNKLQVQYSSLQESLCKLQKDVIDVENVTTHLNEIKKDVEGIDKRVNISAILIGNEVKIVEALKNDTIVEINQWVKRYDLDNLVTKDALRTRFQEFSGSAGSQQLSFFDAGPYWLLPYNQTDLLDYEEMNILLVLITAKETSLPRGAHCLYTWNIMTYRNRFARI